MRYVIQKRSCGSVRISSLNREALRKNLLKAAGRIAKERPEVTRIILFGSVAEDRAGPWSDVDILIVVRDTSVRFIDRALAYLPYFAEAGVGADLFVYTKSEETERSIPLLENAHKNGEILFARS